MNNEHLYIVTYDVADQKRWRKVFRLMHGFGEWVQLSVFQCRLTRARHIELLQRLCESMDASQDHAMIIDVGVADAVELRVQSVGKRGFDPIERVPVIV